VDKPDKHDRRKKEPIPEKALKGFKYFNLITPLLKKLRGTVTHQNRELFYDQYVSLILLYYFNPIITSLRALKQVTELSKVKKLLGIKKCSLGSLSESSFVFDASLLTPLLAELGLSCTEIFKDSRFASIGKELTAVDGTLLPALPKILWALWLDDNHRAAKMHLAFDLMKSIPAWAEITDGNGNEKDVLAKHLEPGKLYVLDCGYERHSLFNAILKAKSSFVVKLRGTAAWKTIEERPLTQDDIAAGVQKDMTVALGYKNNLSTSVRVIEVSYRGPSSRKHRAKAKNISSTGTEEKMYIATDLMDVSSEIVALIYKHRWQIELYFRWFKCIVGFDHLLSHNKNGITIHAYCALIAGMLITLWTGKKPTKRTFEMVCYYFMGWATEEELSEHIEKLQTIQ